MLRALRLNPRLNPVNIPKPGEIFYAQHHYDGGMYSNASRVRFRMQEDGSANATYSHGERPALSSAQVRELFETGSTSPRRNVTLSKPTPE
jgi:hypothetical protein